MVDIENTIENVVKFTRASNVEAKFLYHIIHYFKYHYDTTVFRLNLS